MLFRILTAVVLIPIVVAVVLWAPRRQWRRGCIGSVAGGRRVLSADRAPRNACLSFLDDALSVVVLIYAQWIAGSVETAKPWVRCGTDPNNRWSGDFGRGRFHYFYVWRGTYRGFQPAGPGRRCPCDCCKLRGTPFIALPFSYLVRLMELERFGRALVLFTLCIIWAGDMLAYFIGKFAGRVPLARS